MQTAEIDETLPCVQRATRRDETGRHEIERKPRTKRPRFDTTSAHVQADARPRTGSIALSFAVVYRNTKSE